MSNNEDYKNTKKTNIKDILTSIGEIEGLPDEATKSLATIKQILEAQAAKKGAKKSAKKRKAPKKEVVDETSEQYKAIWNVIKKFQSGELEMAEDNCYRNCMPVQGYREPHFIRISSTITTSNTYVHLKWGVSKPVSVSRGPKDPGYMAVTVNHSATIGSCEDDMEPLKCQASDSMYEAIVGLIITAMERKEAKEAEKAAQAKALHVAVVKCDRAWLANLLGCCDVGYSEDEATDTELQLKLLNELLNGNTIDWNTVAFEKLSMFERDYLTEQLKIGADSSGFHSITVCLSKYKTANGQKSVTVRIDGHSKSAPIDISLDADDPLVHKIETIYARKVEDDKRKAEEAARLEKEKQEERKRERIAAIQRTLKRITED